MRAIVTVGTPKRTVFSSGKRRPYRRWMSRRERVLVGIVTSIRRPCRTWKFHRRAALR